jgi:flagellar motor switch protein FliM
MPQILSQDEVDALLQGIAEGDVDTKAQASPGSAAPSSAFDFASQDRIVRGSLPTLEMIHDRFSRAFRSTISTATRRSIDVNTLSHEMIKFGEFMRTIPLPASLHIFKLEPLKGLAICVFEGRLVFSLIDHFFGGRGRGHVKLEGRDFTPIENRIIRMVMDMVLEDYYNAWQPVHPIQIEYVSSEVNPQFVNVVPSSDLVVAVNMEIELEESTGKLRFCIPYSTIEPIKEKLKAGFQNETLEIDHVWMDRMKVQLAKTQVNLKVDLGSTQILGRDVLNLKEGDIISLHKDQSSPLTIFVEDVPKFLGSLGTFRGNNALRIEQVTPIREGDKDGR